VSDRRCAKPLCSQAAVATVTLDYEGSTMAVGPLAPGYAGEGYDLCEAHAERLTPAQGWQLLRQVESSDDA